MQLSLTTLLPFLALMTLGIEAASIPRDLPHTNENQRRSQIAQLNDAAVERRSVKEPTQADEERHRKVRVKRGDEEGEVEEVEERAPGW